MLEDALELARPDAVLPPDTFEWLTKFREMFHEKLRSRIFRSYFSILPTYHGDCLPGVFKTM